MIKTTDMILEELQSYANPKTKLSRMVKQGKYFQIARGLYETEKNVPGHLLAGSIYGPSYISFEYALGFYGMIQRQYIQLRVLLLKKRKRKNMKPLLEHLPIGMCHRLLFH